ncbi:hypothetical protein MXD62_05340 [Frankia sp. Mgl5]|uniref:hypothetical protein n=1 Tax=Frankia sp. Mgl5 TaxID=2933793 RepID=UPI00200C035F|nr:hypothetical protein [Frankia sp. Mgl5]MCK9926599.1 hypothetical protein [Frankia sp. Mgl5]
MRRQASLPSPRRRERAEADWLRELCLHLADSARYRDEVLLPLRRHPEPVPSSPPTS